MYNYIFLELVYYVLGACPWHIYADRVMEKQWRLEAKLGLAWVWQTKKRLERSILLEVKLAGRDID